MFILFAAVAIVLYFVLESNTFLPSKKGIKYVAYEDDYQAEIRAKREAKIKAQGNQQSPKPENKEAATESEKVDYQTFCNKIIEVINDKLNENERDVLKLFFVANKERIVQTLKKENKFVAVLPTPFEVYLYGASIIYLKDNEHKYKEYEKQNKQEDKESKQYKQENSGQQQPKYKSNVLSKLECFEILEINVSSIPSKQQLKSAYRKAIRKCHPDLFTNRSQSEKLEAEQNSRLVNKANDYLTKYFNY